MHENKSLVACKRIVKSVFFSFLRQSKGQALIVVLLFTVLLLFIGGSTLLLIANHKNSTAREVRQARAAYIAEAGIEMVLAQAKNNSFWVRRLVVGQEYNFLNEILGGQQEYGDGLLEELTVCKLAEDQDKVDLGLCSVGNYRGSRLRLSVEAVLKPYSAGKLFQGVNIGVFPDLDADITGNIMTDELQTSSCLNVNGNIYVRKSMKTTAESYVAVNGDLYCLGDGAGDEESLVLSGAVNVHNIFVQEGKILIGDSVIINGKVYVKSQDQLDELWCQEYQDSWLVDPEFDLVSYFYPVLTFLNEEKLLWYKLNAEYTLQGPAFLQGSDLQDLSGLYYVDGDLNLSGAYSGKATLVVTGKTNIAGDLYSINGSEDCLALITAQGFNLQASTMRIEALIFSGAAGSADGNGPLSFQGSLVVPDFFLTRTPYKFVYDEDLLLNYEENLNWTLCFIKIRKWSQSE